MKNTITTIVVLLSTELLVAQSTREVKTYYDYWKTKIKAVEKVTDNGQLHGQQKYYYENGDLWDLFNFKFDKQDGVQKTFFHNGKLKIISNYKDGKLQGDLKSYKYEKEAYYLYGHAYYENDFVVRQTSYHPNGNKMVHFEANGICNQWFENGKKASEYTNVNGLAEGKVTSWNIDGSISHIGNYSNNVKDGNWEYYGTDGNVIRTENYSMGNKSEKWKILYYGNSDKWEQVSESGKANYFRIIDYSSKSPKSITDNSSRSSVYKAEDYYATGEIQWDGYIQDNNVVEFDEKILVKVGDCKYYHKNGKASAIGTLKHNGRENENAAPIKIGTWLYYDDNGQLEYAEIYQVEDHSGKIYSSKLSAKKTKEQLLKEEEEYRKNIQEADKFFNNGEYQKAVEVYNTAQKIMPNEQYPKQKIVEATTKLTEIKEKQEKAKWQFNESIEKYNQKKKEIESLYVVEDELKSAAFGQTTYKTKKKYLYNAYEILKKDLESKIEQCKDIFKKNELIKLALMLSDKMIELINVDTKNLEKQLKKETDAQKIKEILGL